MPEPTSPMPSRLGLSHALIWLVAAQVGSICWFLVIIAIRHDGSTPDPVPLTTLALVQLAFVFFYGVGPWVTSMIRGNGPAQELGARLAALDAPIGLLAGVVTQLVLWIMYFPILRFVDDDPSEAARELTSLAESRAGRLTLTVMVVVLAPLVEEIFFRGLLLRTLQRHMADWTAVLVQALVFAAVHFQGLQFPGLVVVGLMAGFLAVRSGRLGPSWFMHAAFNGITVLALL